MPTFEQGFAAVETAAGQAAAAAADLAKTARKLLKAAQEGNIAHVRREGARLAETVASAAERANEAAACWPFTADEERSYLEGRFSDELRREAGRSRLTITPRDDALVCSPSIIRVLPADRAVRIDGRRRAAIRPSRLAADLGDNQRRSSKGNPQQFLEALFKAFRIITGPPPTGTLVDATRMVTLDDIYHVFTTLPGASRQYTRTDFARDVYVLDTSEDVKATRTGARVSFHMSTAAKAGRKIISFPDRDGNLISYYGVRFTEDR